MLPILAGPISYGQAIVLGLLQGFSELFPISSLGHSVILPQLLGWDIHQNDAYFITFLVATHLATAIVLFLVFLEDWKRILRGMWRSLAEREIRDDNPEARLGWLLVIGTVPAGVIGLLARGRAARRVRVGRVGVVLPDAERRDAVRRRAAAPSRARAGRAATPTARIASETSWAGSIGIGAAQALALIPGLLAQRRVDGRRPAGRAVERGRRPLLVPAGDADHRRRGAAQAARAVRLRGQRRARAGAGRRALRGADRVPVGAVPDAVLRDEAG